MNDFRTGLTKKFIAQLDEYRKYINKIALFEGNYAASEEEFKECRKKIVDFLNSYDCGMGLGIELRSFICKKYGEAIVNRPENISDEEFADLLESEPEKYIMGYKFILSDKREITVGYFGRNGYDIKKDDTVAYADVFEDILKRYNPGVSVISKDNDRQEFMRLLKIHESVRRNKLFLLCFALHMNNEEAYSFLTKYSGLQRYNYRRVDEAIALFCLSHEEHNSYSEYSRIMEEYNRRDMESEVIGEIDNDFSVNAMNAFNDEIKTEEDLYEFLLNNRVNMGNYSKTAHKEYLKLYYEALDKTGAENPEQLALMMAAMPTVHSNSDLPKSITSNPMISDRINQLKNGKIEVERKDLLFMKFFVFHQDDDYDYDFYKKNGIAYSHDIFVSECNAMLHRCGFSKLSPLNKYENLLLMSFFADRPYEVFEMIVEYTNDKDALY